MWLGRFNTGDTIPLMLGSVSDVGVPTMPDAAPVVQFYNSAGSQVGSDVKLPVFDRYAKDSSGTLNAYFQRRFRLTSSFTAGRYLVLYEWIISAVTYQHVDCFDVQYASDADGNVIGLGVLPRPDGLQVHWDTESGEVHMGRNPH